MTLFERFKAAGMEVELPRQNVPYLGGWMAVLRGTILLMTNSDKEVVVEITEEAAKKFAADITQITQGDAAIAKAALDAAEEAMETAVRWQGGGKRKIHEGSPVIFDQFGNRRVLWLE